MMNPIKLQSVALLTQTPKNMMYQVLATIVLLQTNFTL